MFKPSTTFLVILVLCGLCSGMFDEVDIQKFMDLVDSAPSATTSTVAPVVPETTKPVLQRLGEWINLEPVSTTTKSVAQELAEMTFAPVPTTATSTAGVAAETPGSSMDHFLSMTIPLDKPEPETQSTTTPPTWNVSEPGVDSGCGTVSCNWLVIAVVALLAEL
ncbi:hypothetical protein FOL47_009286 [Perkinsus chesapeaki]|uniref:Uncharacterized protein n=1 Tax=Perkinsus chesapeaki TaxID=330153 RepID=A0A7J6L987_PERCH|nr:hypothetical protein FOL47_009286 [Perkinsus chesapeaki]